MFIRYLNDMKSWILFFLGALGFTNLLIWLDDGLALQVYSIIYLNSLLIISFVVFLIWRYKKENKFTSALDVLIRDTMDEDWLEKLPEPVLSRDEVTEEALHAGVNALRNKCSELNEAHLVERDYMSSWVHEVKTPLTAMRLMIDANRYDPILRKVEAEWLRIHLLIDRQLYISRLPSLESDFVLEVTELQKLAAKEVRELASWCMEKNLAVDIEGAEQEVMTDSKWCRFIIRQLLTNAVKYSPDGGIITITTCARSSGHVVLSITDEGPGIPAYDLPRIFDKGFTGGTGRLQHAATGLGLYLAKMVASKIGITLTVRSQLNQGTIIQMTFTTKNTFESIRT
ncbi:sensor histidine kinase [Paenibacillus assamensis]|uniref:sensor histidine kinase n=1 Tax=Paenibacillus assamensis TaxID=311244 RepID=UPI00041C36C3|nr:sensor histidine kinase [Paenibacillus assamensis]